MVRVWRIPEGGLTEDVTDCVVEFTAKGKITACHFAPTVAGLLATASTGSEGTIVNVWDCNAKCEKVLVARRISFWVLCWSVCIRLVCSISVSTWFVCVPHSPLPFLQVEIPGFHEDQVMDIQFDYWGHLMATTCKDKKVRVLDLRAQDTIAEFEPVESLRDTQVAWVDRHLLLVYGTGKGSRRSLSLWDIQKCECLQTLSHDTSAATYMGHYDPDMQILFTGNNGGTSCQV